MVVKRRFVSAVFLVKIGELSFDKLLNRQNMEILLSRFAFDPSIELIQGQSQVPTIVLKNGIFETGDGHVAFPRMQIEPRKLILDLEGSSKEVSDAYNSVSSALAELGSDVSEGFLEPILVAMETSMISNLAFSIDKLISIELVNLVEDIVQEYGIHESAESRVKPSQITFDVDYLVSDFNLSDYRIGLSPKQLIIGALKGYPLTDQIFESKAPLDTNAHERFLVSLEDSFS